MSLERGVEGAAGTHRSQGQSASLPCPRVPKCESVYVFVCPRTLGPHPHAMCPHFPESPLPIALLPAGPKSAPGSRAQGWMPGYGGGVRGRVAGPPYVRPRSAHRGVCGLLASQGSQTGALARPQTLFLATGPLHRPSRLPGRFFLQEELPLHSKLPEGSGGGAGGRSSVDHTLVLCPVWSPHTVKKTVA